MKMSNIFVGIDNGVTGSIGIIDTIKGTSAFIETPILKCKDYTKKSQSLHRINWKELVQNLPKGANVFIERPMVNPRAFSATKSALRALEATLISLEMCDLKYVFIDSKEWQQEFFPSSVIGHKELKEISRIVGIELFPNHTSKINKHGDSDGLLICEYARKKYSKEIHS
jgi:hypothetical protein